jgi:hypothetical protein
VFAALGEALSPTPPTTFPPVAADLRSAGGPASAWYVDIMPASQFWGRVAKRPGADDAAARLVTDAAFGQAFLTVPARRLRRRGPRDHLDRPRHPADLTDIGCKQLGLQPW